MNIKVLDCGCQLAWDKTGPQAVHVSKTCPGLKAGHLTPATWDGKMKQFMSAHKGYLRGGSWVWRK